MKTKKLLSLLLALMMMLSVVPFYASAAEPIALKATHVTEWPIAEGEIYFGQMVSEGITISGGKVVYEGVEVPGKFVHWNNEFRPTAASDVSKASITFVPDDSAAYKGFNKLLSADVTYKVKKTTAVLKNENDIPQASSIKEGQTLSASKIAGGEVLNPYRTDLDLSSIAWEWENPDLVVTESGEYTAVMPLNENCYEKLIMKVYVEVEKDIIGTIIEEKPSFSIEFGQNFVDGIISGGKATANGEEVSGTFDISDYWKNYKAESAGTFDIEIVFTPDDTEKYLPSTTTVTVTVDPIPISFIDSEGNAVVEGFEFEVEPGTKMGDVKALLSTVLRVPANSVIQVEDSNNYAQNGRTYKLTVLHDDSNYTGNELYFTVKFKNVEVAPRFKPGYLKSSIDCGDYNPTGTFTVSLDGKEIAVVKANEEFTYTVENSGDHVLSAKYNPVENDYFIIADFETTVNVKLKRLLTCVNTVSDGSNTYYPGDKVEISANLTAENFAGWKVTDKAGNEVTVDGVDNSKRIISITMPDYDITVEALKKNATGGTTGGIDDIFGDLGDLGNLTEGDSDNAIVNVFNNIIAWIKNIINTIIELFRSIGDNT